MRTIKFRGLSIETPNKGEWTVGSLFHDLRDGMYSIWDEQARYWMRVDPATVGQFTGLIDKNGKEIWEGDILMGDSYPAAVIYDNDLCQFRLEETGNHDGVRYHNVDAYTYSPKVLGNIYEPKNRK